MNLQAQEAGGGREEAISVFLNNQRSSSIRDAVRCKKVQVAKATIGIPEHPSMKRLADTLRPYATILDACWRDCVERGNLQACLFSPLAAR
jgi:hypothetical protein